MLQTVSGTMEMMAPKWVINQIEIVEQCIHAYVAIGKDDNAFMEKWDMKGNFWRMNENDGDKRTLS